LALLSSLGAYVSGFGVDQAVPLGPLLRQEFKDWYACGVLSLGVLWFCGRNRLEPGKTRRWLLVHLAAGCVFSVIYATATAWLVAGEQSVMMPGKILTFPFLLKKMALHYFVLNLIMYWLVVFGHLGWHYYARYSEREVQAVELKRELVEARLDALRMQLNPHFLFNTLHAISALIHEDPEAADRMVARLSELLRLSLDQSKPQQVPLSEEMVFLDRYLEIERARFGERLKIEKQLGPDTHTAMVPFLLLQPLVENAVRHGIEAREEAGHIAISARRNNGTLELSVRDDGPGLSRETNAPVRKGIGLANTRSRLRHLYGENFQLNLSDLAEGGLEARVEIPYRPQLATA
jgi:signal transduction histidine kinase